MLSFIKHNKLLIFLSALLAVLIAVTWQTAINNNQSNTAAVSGKISNQSLAPIEVSFEAGAGLAVNDSLKRIYYAKNENDKRAIASLTKLFSAAVVLENYDLTDEIDISSSAISKTKEVDGVRIDLSAGDTIRVFDLLAAMLINSSNEAAYALAESWPKGGADSEERIQLFVEAMNGLAQRADLSNTLFSDPSGLDDGGYNYSSAWDIAKFSRWLHRYPLLLEISRQSEYVFYSLEGRRYNLTSSNQLFSSINGIVLTKTGFTEGAGQSIIIEVIRPKQNIIIVLLDAEDRFENARELINKINELNY